MALEELIWKYAVYALGFFQKKLDPPVKGRV